MTPTPSSTETTAGPVPAQQLIDALAALGQPVSTTDGTEAMSTLDLARRLVGAAERQARLAELSAGRDFSEIDGAWFTIDPEDANSGGVLLDHLHTALWQAHRLSATVEVLARHMLIALGDTDGFGRIWLLATQNATALDAVLGFLAGLGRTDPAAAGRHLDLVTNLQVQMGETAGQVRADFGMDDTPG